MKKEVLILAIAAVSFLQTSAQIMPIPQYKKQFADVKSYLYVFKDKDLKSNRNEDKFEAGIKGAVDTLKGTLNLIAKRLNFAEDTLFFENGQTLYLHKKNRTIIFVTNSINQSLRQDYLSLRKADSLKKTEYQGVILKIDSLTNNVPKMDDSYEVSKAVLVKKRNTLKAEMDQLKHQLDSFKNEISYNIEGQRLQFPIALSFYKKRKQLASIFNRYYYGRNDFTVTQAVELSRAAGITNFNTELGSGFIKTFRLALSANINKVEEADSGSVNLEKSELEKLLQNGGQLAFKVVTPLAFYSNTDDFFHAGISFLNQLSTDVIPNETNANKYNISNTLGGSFALDISTEDKKWTLFAELPFAYVFGNPKFYDNFSFKDFSVLQGSFGLAYNKQLAIKFSGVMLSTQRKLQYTPWSIGLQLTPPATSK